MPKYTVPVAAKLSGSFSYEELEDINNRLTHVMAAAITRHIMYGDAAWEHEHMMDFVERLKNATYEFGEFSLPPPKVTDVIYSPDYGYVVKVDQQLPPIPGWIEVKSSFEAIPYQEGDVGTAGGDEDFECEKTYLGSATGTPAPFGFPANLPVDALMDYQIAGESKLKIKPSGEVIVAPGGPFYFDGASPTLNLGEPGVGSLPGATGEPGFIPGPPDGLRGPVGPGCAPGPNFFRTTSTKPLMYSVDVYRSLKDTEFVALSSFSIVDINTGLKIKPYAVGRTVQEAMDKLADSIRGQTARKEIGVINEHMYITRYVCIHCSNDQGHPSKQDLLNHLTSRHGGNLSVDKYSNPTASNTWMKLP